VDVLQDDLLPERLTLDGLEVVSSDRERLADEATGAVVYRVRHHLVTYEIPPRALRIADQTLRYYVRRPGQRLDDTAPAGETQVRGAAIALRSALPDDAKAVALRDEAAAATLPRALLLLRPLGLGLLLLAAAPAAFWGVALAQRMAARKSRSLAPRARAGAALARSALDELPRGRRLGRRGAARGLRPSGRGPARAARACGRGGTQAHSRRDRRAAARGRAAGRRAL
jgi:hypothetical protein